jgi:hypothetical protein
MASRQTRILILCKTYPSPSAKHAETSCVSGIEKDGALIRLYPVPFRLISDENRFRKWQWINARIAKKDHRRESYKIFVDTIVCDPRPLSTNNSWHARRECIKSIPIFGDFGHLEAARKHQGTTLGLIRPSRIEGLDITPADKPDWTPEEKRKLLHLQHQGDLFDEADSRSIAVLKKLPFDFHYRYICELDGRSQEYRHKIVDWEIGALYWNVRRSHGASWETAVRAKLEDELPSRDFMFLMGTIHRYPDQWLIVSLIYPPKPQPDQPRQRSLFDL